jgi:hypothetical protein
MGNTKGLNSEYTRIYLQKCDEYVKNNQRVPIRKGCQNKQCFCTGACDEIVGYKDKIPK